MVVIITNTSGNGISNSYGSGDCSSTAWECYLIATKMVFEWHQADISKYVLGLVIPNNTEMLPKCYLNTT